MMPFPAHLSLVRVSAIGVTLQAAALSAAADQHQKPTLAILCPCGFVSSIRVLSTRTSLLASTPAHDSHSTDGCPQDTSAWNPMIGPSVPRTRLEVHSGTLSQSDSSLWRRRR